MTARLFRNIVLGLISILLLSFLFLCWLSIEAVNETENWSFFDFDFTNKDGVISSYGSLLAAILSFMAILFVILDLFYQRRLNQSERDEKENEEIQEYRDNLNIIRLFIDELKRDALDLFKSSSEYMVREKQYPTEMNRMSFSPNTYPKLILDVDRIRFYEAIKHFQPSNDWKKVYVDLYKIVDYYGKSFDELKEKHQIHLDKKFKHSRELAIALDKFIDTVMDIRNEIINICKDNGTHSKDDPFFPILQFIKEKVTEISSNQPSDEERVQIDFVNPTSFTVWHDEVLKPVFDDILESWNEHGSDPYNFKSILNQSQSLIREYSRLIQDSMDYATHIESYSMEYFSEESKYLIRLSEISKELDNEININESD